MSQTNTRAAIAASALLLALYVALRKSSPRLIDSPEAVAHRVTANVKDDDPIGPVYDVVIIGGGTAGCVLAARLSEIPHCRVLLLEAGRRSVRLHVSLLCYRSTLAAPVISMSAVCPSHSLRI